MGFFKKRKKVEVKVTEPYCISLNNTTDKKREWTLFGSNKFIGASNFGNSKGIIIEDLNGNSYESILNEFNSDFMKVKKVRFSTNKSDNMNQTIHHHRHLNGGGFGSISYERRDYNVSISMDIYQQQSNIVDMDCNTLVIDASTHLTGTIEPNSKITITFMPVEKGNGKYRVGVLSGRNLTPVIILSSIASKFNIIKRIKNYFILRKFNKQQTK